MDRSYLDSVKKQFAYYKMLGEKAMLQIPDEALFWQYNEDSNSIAVIVNHICGNMLSRFTDFLTADGEKSWRNRDAEFENIFTTRNAMMERWDTGWNLLYATLADLDEEQLENVVFIRKEPHTVTEAINRQLAHYPYHIGQIVYIAKMAASKNWESLSIPKNKSGEYNRQKFM